MTSLDQAFVKAYARRVHNRSSETSAPETATDAVTGADQTGSLLVNDSVAQSTQVWIAPDEDQQLRTDEAHHVANRPNAPTRRRIPSVAPHIDAEPTPLSPQDVSKRTDSGRPVSLPVPDFQPARPTAPAEIPQPATASEPETPLLFEMETYPAGSTETAGQIHVAYALASLNEPSVEPEIEQEQDAQPLPKRSDPPETTATSPSLDDITRVIRQAAEDAIRKAVLETAAETGQEAETPESAETPVAPNFETHQAETAPDHDATPASEAENKETRATAPDSSAPNTEPENQAIERRLSREVNRIASAARQAAARAEASAAAKLEARIDRTLHAPTGRIHDRRPNIDDSATATPTAGRSDTAGIRNQANPLQSQSSAAIKPAPPIQPCWEVDAFDIPETVRGLFFDGHLASRISRQLSDAVDAGMTSIQVTSCRPAEGRSTVAIGLALSAARSGLDVALIDGDLNQPTLADDLRIDIEQGWSDSAKAGLPVDEVAVRALSDGVTLIPLARASEDPASDASHFGNLVSRLKSSFDLVIVDSPSSTTIAALLCAEATETAVIVRDAASTSELDVNRYASTLRSLGVKGIGVVENFAQLEK